MTPFVRNEAQPERRSGTLRAWRAAALFGTAAMLGVAVQPSRAASSCSARSASAMAPIIELYTSEGCSSCPPADRWLSALKRRPDIVALAFHVDYWDRLGWTDRFASALYTRRQAEQQRVNGARFSYTPQVVIDGRDRTDWSRAVIGVERPAAQVDIELSHDGEHVTAQVALRPGGPTQLAAYWAVTESGHRSAVKSGENEGATLLHDFVVRDYQPVASWTPSGASPHRFGLTLPRAADATHPRTLNLVVIDALSGRPLQALALPC
jgi:hypothetical protein